MRRIRKRADALVLTGTLIWIFAGPHDFQVNCGKMIALFGILLGLTSQGLGQWLARR